MIILMSSFCICPEYILLLLLAHLSVASLAKPLRMSQDVTSDFCSLKLHMLCRISIVALSLLFKTPSSCNFRTLVSLPTHISHVRGSWQSLLVSLWSFPIYTKPHIGVLQCPVPAPSLSLSHPVSSVIISSETLLSICYIYSFSNYKTASGHT